MKNTSEKTLPAIIDRAVWEKVTIGRAGVRWDSAVEKARKGIGGNQEDMVSADTFGRYKTESEERTETGGRLALRNKVKPEKGMDAEVHGLKRRDRKENVSVRPNGLRETLKLL